MFRSGGPSRQLGGLVNIGYNCYVNAVLQVLAYTPGFPEFCLNLPNVMYQHNSSSAFFLDSFGHVFAELGGRQSTCPTWILGDSALLGDQFRLPIQQDAHEYLLHLLDAFQRECTAAMPDSSDTMISHFFTCNLTITVHCTACGASTARHTTSNDLTIPMRRPFNDCTISTHHQQMREDHHSRNLSRHRDVVPAGKDWANEPI
jgi:ubiquitin carboxyl-terminal hydrolase 36/42